MTRAVLVEAWRIARAQPVATAITSLLVATVVVTVLLTTGRVALTERDVIERFEQAGARTVVFTDNRGTAGLTGASVDRVAALSGVEWVIGLGPAQDGTNAALGAAGAPVAVRSIHGRLEPIIRIDGHDPTGVHAAAGSGALRTLGLPIPAGGILLDDGNTAAIIARLDADPPVEFLADTVVVRPTDPSEDVRVVYAVVRNPTTIEQTAAAALAVLDPVDPTALAVATPTELADLRSVVTGDIGDLSRRLLLIVLAIGLSLVTTVTYATTALRRRDFGRRRALGATRSLIVALVAATTTIGACAGAVAGTIFAIVYEAASNNPLPNSTFTLATAVLVVTTSALASVPPAVAAANRDPVRILRIP